MGDSEQNVDVVRRVYDAALRRDTEAVISHLDPAVRADVSERVFNPTSTRDTTATGVFLGEIDAVMTFHDASALLGHDIEIHVENDGPREFFGMIRDGAGGWDGSTPMRPASS